MLMVVIGYDALTALQLFTKEPVYLLFHFADDMEGSAEENGRLYFHPSEEYCFTDFIGMDALLHGHHEDDKLSSGKLVPLGGDAIRGSLIFEGNVYRCHRIIFQKDYLTV